MREVDGLSAVLARLIGIGRNFDGRLRRQCVWPVARKRNPTTALVMESGGELHLAGDRQVHKA